MIAFTENWLNKFAEFGLQIEKFMWNRVLLSERIC